MERKKILIGMLALGIIIPAVYIVKQLSPGPEENPGHDKKKHISTEFDSMQMAMEDERIDEDPPRDESVIEKKLNTLPKKKFISDVILEKNVVCAGEDMDVNVILENPGGPTSDLLCMIGGQIGPKVIVRFSDPGQEDLLIIVRDKEGNFDNKKVSIQITECPGKPMLTLGYSFSKQRAEAIDFTITEKKNIECPCTFEWDFGDGTPPVSGGETQTHDYGARNQDTFTTTFLVSVRVAGLKNRSAAGRVSVSLANAYWVADQVGYLPLPIVYEIYPDLRVSNNSLDITVRNVYNQEITMESAVITSGDCNRNSVSKTTNVPAGSLMKDTRFTGGSVRDETLTLPPSAVSDPNCSVRVVVSGHLPDGTPVKGVVHINRE